MLEAAVSDTQYVAPKLLAPARPRHVQERPAGIAKSVELTLPVTGTFWTFWEAKAGVLKVNDREVVAGGAIEQRSEELRPIPRPVLTRRLLEGHQSTYRQQRHFLDKKNERLSKKVNRTAEDGVAPNRALELNERGADRNRTSTEPVTGPLKGVKEVRTTLE